MILASYRPGSHAVVDMEIGQALSEIERDPALKSWFEHQNAFHATIHRCFEESPVPANLPDRIFASSKILSMPLWRRRPLAWAAVFAFVILGALLVTLKWPTSPNHWGKFRDRLVAWSSYEYRMDIVTNQLAALREFHSSRNAPSDYTLPRGLAALPPLGGGLLTWHDHPASMVCLNFQNREVLYLFVIESANVESAPPNTPVFAKRERFLTASWTDGTKSYLLAAPIGIGGLDQFF